MKKYLYTLLFMAVALFSAATMVSCDDDEVVNLTDKYTITFEVNTNDPKVKESEAYKSFIAKMQTKLQKLTNKEYYLSDTQAKAEWLGIELGLKNDTEIQNLLDILAKSLNDTTLSCSLKMLKNGNEWKHIDWTTWYHGY